MNKSCYQCVYWEFTGSSRNRRHSDGICHRFPPLAGTRKIQDIDHQPWTMGDDWCGEHVEGSTVMNGAISRAGKKT